MDALVIKGIVALAEMLAVENATVERGVVFTRAPYESPEF